MAIDPNEPPLEGVEDGVPDLNELVAPWTIYCTGWHFKSDRMNRISLPIATSAALLFSAQSFFHPRNREFP